jgi:hypothetical protein
VGFASRKAVTCPAEDDYAPCGCTEESSGAIYVNCNTRSMTDSMASSVLQAFLNTPGVSPVFYLDFAYNHLTKVPDEFRLFDQIHNVNLRWNKIHSIPSKAFLFSKSFRNHLTLENNQISAIGAGAFQGATPIFLFIFKLCCYGSFLFQLKVFMTNQPLLICVSTIYLDSSQLCSSQY